MSSIDFFIIGTQKGGTTATDQYLRHHPDIMMSNKKEIHFFDRENIDWRSPDYSLLHQHFSWDSVKVRGESTPIYIYWPNSLERLRRYNPSARLILLLRHPVDRAFSHWRMETARAADTLGFADAVSPLARLRVSGASGGVHRVFSYVERGFYADQIDRLLGLFPVSQILFMRTDRIWSDPAGSLAKITHFLGVGDMPPLQRRYVTPVPSPAPPPMPRALRLDLQQIFSDDIARTATLTDIDLSDWLSLDYSEPMGS